jgi:hypothetical protein
MATLKEIEVRIQEHENRLLQLQNDRDKTIKLRNESK